MKYPLLHLALDLTLVCTGCTRPAAAPPRATGPMKLLVPQQGAYTGAFIDFGDREDTVTLDAIEKFEKLVGKKQAIVASSSYWGEQTFPSENVALIFRHRAVPLIYWSPWDRPYDEFEDNSTNDPAKYLKGDKFALTEIIAGKWDAYIDRWGDSARAYGQPLLVSFCNEMNGNWFPWSGFFYGGGKIIGTNKPYRYEGPEIFKKAFHHVVDRVRARGATNIQWVFHVMNLSYPQDTWNLVASYYPGPGYVDWLGLSVYGQQDSHDPWAEFREKMVNGKIKGGLLRWPYDELAALDPGKPIMIAEWGIGEFPKFGDKSQWIRDAFAEMSNVKKYPRIKAAVFWHERWENEDGTYSNLRVNSTPESLAAYRQGVANPFWLDAPLLAPREAKPAR